jgi:hypothetical protein
VRTAFFARKDESRAMSPKGQTMPFDSCPSNVRFSFPLPENCHSASGQLRSRLIRARLSRSIDDRRSSEADIASTIPAGRHG